MSAHPLPSGAASAPTAVLIVNLGTPDAPTADAVRAYLDEFLSDPRVVRLPRWLWLPLLRRVILPRRSPKVAHKYAEIWLEGGSPLAVYTRRLAEAVDARMPELRVVHAMRYGRPALAQTMRALAAEGIRRILVLPLYPQYSTTTTASVADRIAETPIDGVEVRMIEDYAREPAWLQALAASVHAHRQAHGRGEVLLCSFHGIPQRIVDQGDPYAERCEATFRGLVDALGPDAGDCRMAYQSRFGAGKWLQPATDATLVAMAKAGVREVDVLCPGFPADCLETLEEIAMQNAELFVANGGTRLRYIPCLNDAPAHADAMVTLLRRELDAWT
ncbi:ferrochelatase [Luteimonas sp. RC10]|uniref:ferrochelatase n=1 Tax=Luteimonas sp. RC10 TaxID=2587035 RepID=UPI00161A8315|nr:ferrochelatase [Luteimonas sp. RC10]MBB3342810.1 ferrochelatase [Luteimonas sp. RC10]